MEWQPISSSIGFDITDKHIIIKLNIVLIGIKPPTVSNRNNISTAANNVKVYSGLQISFYPNRRTTEAPS